MIASLRSCFLFFAVREISFLQGASLHIPAHIISPHYNNSNNLNVEREKCAQSMVSSRSSQHQCEGLKGNRKLKGEGRSWPTRNRSSNQSNSTSSWQADAVISLFVLLPPQLSVEN